MPREVSRRTSKPPEQKAKVVRPDIPGKRDLDPRIVEDRVDPALELEREQYGKDQDQYLRTLGSTEGKSRGGQSGR
jgi:hypothetical protein